MRHEIAAPGGLAMTAFVIARIAVTKQSRRGRGFRARGEAVTALQASSTQGTGGTSVNALRSPADQMPLSSETYLSPCRKRLLSVTLHESRS